MSERWTPAPWNVVIHALTDAGRVRDHNEDTFWFDEKLGAAIVADGVGGHAAGEVASRLTVERFADQVETQLVRAQSLDQVKALMAKGLHRANDAVLQAIDSDTAKQGMGSTAVCVCLWEDLFTIAHIGDSRAYLFRDGQLTLLTKDHSYVQLLVDQGVIEPEEAATHAQRNIITRCVGNVDEAEADLCALEAEGEDRLLLCSDGLTEVVPDREIEAICREHKSGRKLCSALVQRTLDGGAPDNVTVAVVTLEKGGVVKRLKTLWDQRS